MTQVAVANFERARQEIALLDEKQAWTSLQSKDVPVAITGFVVEALKKDTLDTVRRKLGMPSPTDPRWRKIMTAIRTGQRIDATGIFLQWMTRNEKWADAISAKMDEMIAEDRPFSKMILEGVKAISQLQMDTVKMGKELGVFVDPADQKSAGGQGVTIVVQTNIPSPPKDVIAQHQAMQREKAAVILEANKPK
jgi:hypothetical protein